MTIGQQDLGSQKHQDMAPELNRNEKILACENRWIYNLRIKLS